MFLYTRVIIDINVLTNNQELKKIILNELDKSNTTKYSIVKKEQELNQIKNKILDNNKDKIEWLNIKRQGMKYIINIEPKIQIEKIEEPNYCNIISTKDATITRIYNESGIELKEVNEYVKKGEIIISGEIKKDEEIKSYTCAKGKVFATTWYTINIEIPKYYDKTIKTGRKRPNILIKYHNNKTYIFKTKYKDNIITNKKILNIFGLEIYLSKEIQIEKEQTLYNEEEIESKIEQLIEEKMAKTLNGESKIKYKKTLKKTDNDSKIIVDMFIVAEEEIGKTIIATIPNIE